MAASENFQLPDCTTISEEPTDDDFLSLLPKSELVRALAERGIVGAQDLLRKEEAKGGMLARRIATFRERLRRQATRSMSHLTRDYERRMGEMESVRVRSRKLYQEEVDRLRASLDRAKKFQREDIVSDPALLEAVRSALLIPSDALRESFEDHRSAWEKFRDWLRALWAKILAFFRGKKAREEVEKKAKKGRPMTLARLAIVGRNLSPEMTGDLFQEFTPEQLQALQDSTRRNLQGEQRKKEKEVEEKDDQYRRAQEDLKTESEMARKELERNEEQREKQEIDWRLSSELRERGFATTKDGKFAVSYSLVEKFAGLVLSEEEKNLPLNLRLSLRGMASTGLYERGRMREQIELSRMDLAGSLLASRLRGSRHLLEEESYVYREVRSESLHAVLLLDVSGSMAEGDKLTAAKKALLALYTAVRRRYPDSIVDIVAFDSEVRPMDLVELWEAKPGSFTNTGEALHVAHQLLRSSRATRKELYLITDGLPESYTADDRSIKSGNLGLSLAYAVARSRELATVNSLVSTLVLLKSDNPAYEKAARDLARVLRGSVVVTDPRRLAFELLIRFAGQSVVEQAMAPAKGEAPTVRKPTVAETMAQAGSAKDRRRARRQAKDGAAAG